MLTESDLKDVLAEIAEWPLSERRAYLKNVETAFGKEASDQIKRGLQELWEARK